MQRRISEIEAKKPDIAEGKSVIREQNFIKINTVALH